MQFPNTFEARRDAVMRLVKYVRAFTVATAVLQLLAGFVSFGKSVTTEISGVFIAVYVIIFAVLLLCYEARIEASDEFLRQNFGFLYSYRGLGVYLFFMGLMDFGMIAHWFGILAGILACTSAMVVLAVGYYSPKINTVDLEGGMNVITHKSPIGVPAAPLSYGSSASSAAAAAAPKPANEAATTESTPLTQQ